MPADPGAREIRVVGAVIVHDGLVLCAQRGTGELAGLWEFPGGKVEDGESAPEALAREIEEELGCRVAVREEIATARHAYRFGTVVMTTFRCELTAGTPHPAEHRELRWLPPSALPQLEWAPVDLPTVRLIAG
jgi:8-oxo-dGTP diphosphatase